VGVPGIVGQVEEALGEGVATGGVATDDEQGVVAGDRAEDVTEVGLVEGAGQELCGARRRTEDDEVGARLGAHQQLGAQPGQPVAAGGALARRGHASVAPLPRHRVDERAVGAADLDGVELDEVAAQRGLGDADAVVAEEVGQLGLGAHRVGGHDVDDPLVAGALGQRGHGRHDDFSRSQVSTAFWACRRFSASSQTTECGPSMTSSEISLPR
jgi:hypothetical protein